MEGTAIRVGRPAFGKWNCAAHFHITCGSFCPLLLLPFPPLPSAASNRSPNSRVSVPPLSASFRLIESQNSSHKNIIKKKSICKKHCWDITRSWRACFLSCAFAPRPSAQTLAGSLTRPSVTHARLYTYVSAKPFNSTEQNYSYNFDKKQKDLFYIFPPSRSAYHGVCAHQHLVVLPHPLQYDSVHDTTM